jgi:hypothetical protein
VPDKEKAAAPDQQSRPIAPRPRAHTRPEESRAAKCLMDPLVRFWRLGVAREVRLILIRAGEHAQKFLERAEVVPLHNGRDDLDPVLAP